MICERAYTASAMAGVPQAPAAEAPPPLGNAAEGRILKRRRGRRTLAV